MTWRCDSKNKNSADSWSSLIVFVCEIDLFSGQIFLLSCRAEVRVAVWRTQVNTLEVGSTTEREWMVTRYKGGNSYGTRCGGRKRSGRNSSSRTSRAGSKMFLLSLGFAYQEKLREQ